MTREEVSAQIADALAGASKVAPKALIAALNAAAHFIQNSGTDGDARNATINSQELVSKASSSPFSMLAGQCADELDEALALKIGVMDSESKALAIGQQRIGAMQAVSARLREAAQA